MNIWQRTRTTAVGLAVMALVGTGAWAQEQEHDQQAVELARSVMQHLSAAETLSARIDSTIVVTGQGMRQEMTDEYAFALQRPDKLALILEEGTQGQTVVVDGESVYEYMPMWNRYVQRDAPQDLEAYFARVDEHDQFGMGMMEGVLPMLAPFLSEQAFQDTQDMVAEIRYEGEEELDGEMHEKIVMVIHEDDPMADMPEEQRPPGMQQIGELEFPITLWLTQADEPVVARISPDVSALLEAQGQMMPGMGDIQMDYQITFEGWQVNEPVDEQRFAFDPPEGAQASASWQEAIEAEMEAQMAAQGNRANPADVLVGDPAPEFELELADGGRMSLADHEGDIVILDFWATWCGPCVQSMPVYDSVAREYADEGVVLYAVNQREGVEEVEQFLENQGLDLKVPMDRQGEVGELYHVRGIPQTVIIDREGVVQAVHVGFGPTTEQQLRDELDALVAGESLVRSSGQ